MLRKRQSVVRSPVIAKKADNVMPELHQQVMKFLRVAKIIQEMRFDSVMADGDLFLQFTQYKAFLNNLVRKIYDCMKNFAYLHNAPVNRKLAKTLKKEFNGFVSNSCSKTEYSKQVQKKIMEECNADLEELLTQLFAQPGDKSRQKALGTLQKDMKKLYENHRSKIESAARNASEAFASFDEIQATGFHRIKEICGQLEEQVQDLFAVFEGSISAFPLLTKSRFIAIITDYEKTQWDKDKKDFLFLISQQFMETKAFEECEASAVIPSGEFLKALSPAKRRDLFAYYDWNNRADEKTYLYQLLLNETFTVTQLHEEAEAYNVKRFEEEIRLPEETWQKVFNEVNLGDYKNIIQTCSFFGRVLSAADYSRQIVKNYCEQPKVTFQPFARDALLCLDKQTVASGNGKSIAIFNLHYRPGVGYDWQLKKECMYPSSRLIKVSEHIVASHYSYGSRNSIQLVNWQTGCLESEIEISATKDKHIASFAVTKTGKLIVQTTCGTLHFFALDSKRCEHTIECAGVASHTKGLLISNDGKIISRVCEQGNKKTIRIYDEEAKLLKEINCNYSNKACCLLAENRLAILECDEKRQMVVRILDLSDLHADAALHYFKELQSSMDHIVELPDGTLFGVRENSSCECKVLDLQREKIINQWEVDISEVPEVLILADGNILLYMPLEGCCMLSFPNMKRALQEVQDQQPNRERQQRM